MILAPQTQAFAERHPDFKIDRWNVITYAMDALCSTAITCRDILKLQRLVMKQQWQFLNIHTCTLPETSPHYLPYYLLVDPPKVSVPIPALEYFFSIIKLFGTPYD
jgi:hypothetical protein